MKETFGQRLQRLRKSLGLKQDDIANKLNVTPQAVSKWENDISSPDISILSDLADIYKVSLDELLGKEKAKTEIVAPENKKDLNKMILKIKVDSADGDKVNINLPLTILLSDSKNNGIINKMFSKNDNLLGNIDWDNVLELIKNGLVGELMRVDSADGDVVIIGVE